MKTSLTLTILAATLALAGCNKSTKDAQADAVRDTTSAAASDMESQADGVENQAAAIGGTTENSTVATADAMRDSADTMRKEGEAKADAVEAGTMGATTTTDSASTTTLPTR